MEGVYPFFRGRLQNIVPVVIPISDVMLDKRFPQRIQSVVFYFTSVILCTILIFPGRLPSLVLTFLYIFIDRSSAQQEYNNNPKYGFRIVAGLVEEETVWRTIYSKNSLYLFLAHEFATMSLKIPERIMAVS